MKMLAFSLLLLLSHSLFAKMYTVSTHQVSPNKLIILLGDYHGPQGGIDYSQTFFSNLEKKEARRIKFLIEGGEQLRETSRKVPPNFLNNYFIKNQGFPVEIANLFSSVLYPNQPKKYEVEDCNFRSNKIIELPEQIVQFKKSNDVDKKQRVHQELNEMIRVELNRVNNTLIKLNNIDAPLTQLLQQKIDTITKNLNQLPISEFMNISYLDFASYSQDIDAFYMALSSPANVVIFYGGFEHTKYMRKISSEMGWKEGFFASEDVGNGDIGLEKGFSLLNQEVDQFMNTFDNKCTSCDKVSNDLRSCSRCKKAKYCNPTCQKNDWKEHKLSCK